MPRPTFELIIEEREPFADGVPFEGVGAYERIEGQVRFGLDPDDLRNQPIVDLDHAPRNSEGLVEYSTSLFVLKPVDMERGNRRLLYDVNNRGNKRALQFFNDAPSNPYPRTLLDAGNGFLMRRGYTIVWSGWQGDLLPVDGRMTMQLPVAIRNKGAITGAVRAEFIVEDPDVHSLPLSGNHYIRPYESTSLDTASALLTCRRLETEPRERITSTAWKFARLVQRGVLESSPTHCYLEAGFHPGWIYELVYQARNPLVLGLGFAGVRDLVDFLRHAARDSNEHTNPLWNSRAGIEKAYAWGRSQSGRFLREFIYRGFNVGENNRRVFDGISSHVAGAGRLALNYRFAQPDRYPRQHEDHLYLSDQFPFSYSSVTDSHTGQSDAILKRPESDPLVVHTQTSTEYWQRRGSLVHTDTSGSDLPEHPGVRIYLLSSLQHNDIAAAAEGGRPRFPLNPVPANPLLRALLDALDEWASHGTPPPASHVPKRSNETLIQHATFERRFPRIPGVNRPPTVNRLFVQEHGPNFDRGILETEPPTEDQGREYPIFVPGVDADGNEMSGIPSPEIAVPLATYAGWNLRADSEIMAGIAGSMIVFALTWMVRQERNDPRPSIEERYRSKADYLNHVRTAAERLAAKRFYLNEDIERCLERAAKTWDTVVSG